MRYITLILLFCLSLLSEDEYQLGEGFQVSSLPFYIGGYFSLDYTNGDDFKQYRVDDIAFLAYGSYSNFSYLAELEFKKFYVKTEQNGISETTRDDHLYIERLYLDYNLNENYMFRFGKYNSPIGFWNLIPINVLRETTSSPLSTTIIFPKFTTGLNTTYSSFGKGSFKADLMLQHSEDFDESYNNYNNDVHYGLGLSYEQDDFTIKVNGGYFHRDEDTVVEDSLYYLLLSAKYEADSYQFMAELGTQKFNKEFTTKYAGYLQGLYRFTPKHIVVARAESYDNSITGVADDMMILGYTYRPLYPVAIKSEYQFHSNSNSDQFLFSFSMLF